ncbi:helix-turn-helix domain-containing protein [Mesorhizobium sp. M1409]|uniref:XRE family transcriptional regulator n=1 Tax=unclassified Mesorhizobium TaxID=325217 RepID=UPI003338A88C
MIDAPGCGDIFDDFGGSDRDRSRAKTDFAGRIVLAMDTCRLMDEEVAALTGLERDQMRCIVRGRVVDGISVERLETALEALEVWQRARAFIAG